MKGLDAVLGQKHKDKGKERGEESGSLGVLKMDNLEVGALQAVVGMVRSHMHLTDVDLSNLGIGNVGAKEIAAVMTVNAAIVHLGDHGSTSHISSPQLFAERLGSGLSVEKQCEIDAFPSPLTLKIKRGKLQSLARS